MKRLIWAAIIATAAVSNGIAAAGPVGETHRVATEPAAAVRDARHRDVLRITVWYPAAADSEEREITLGPPEQPLRDIGRAAPDAPFAAGGPRPVILLSHGFGGSARSWDGSASRWPARDTW